MKEINKHSHTILVASFDIYEVDTYLKGGYDMKKQAKKASRKAHRQLDKAIINEALND